MLKYYVIAVLAIAGGWHIYQKQLGGKDLLAGALDYADKNPGTSWAPRIDYYVGVMYLKRDKPGQARDTFLKLLADYPTSQYIPKAMIHLFRAAKDVHDWDNARMALELYVEDYPDGGDIGLAKAQLDKLYYEHGGR